ncbi:MAG: hypothetical protein HYZ75_11795 [Elusimicrobia bacterium]|nr:hypothetical protein [Elusimicrobiota bacterium]
MDPQPSPEPQSRPAGAASPSPNLAPARKEPPRALGFRTPHLVAGSCLAFAIAAFIASQSLLSRLPWDAVLADPAQPPAVEPAKGFIEESIPLVVLDQEEAPLTPLRVGPSPLPVGGEGMRAPSVDDADLPARDRMSPMKAGRGTQPKPRLRLISNIYDVVARNGDDGNGFQGMNLRMGPSGGSGAFLAAAPNASRRAEAAPRAAAPPSSVGRMFRSQAPGRQAQAAPSRTAAPAPSALPDCKDCTGTIGAQDRQLHVDRSKPAATAGDARFVGMCGNEYAYEITNRTNRTLDLTLGDDHGKSWRTGNLPPGGSTRISSPHRLSGLTGLVNR